MFIHATILHWQSVCVSVEGMESISVGFVSSSLLYSFHFGKYFVWKVLQKKRNKFWFNSLNDSSHRITERMQPRCILCVMLKDTEPGGLSLSPGFSARSGRREREWKREGERIHTWKSEAVPRTSLQQHFLFFLFFVALLGVFRGSNRQWGTWLLTGAQVSAVMPCTSPFAPCVLDLLAQLLPVGHVLFEFVHKKMK